jgi:hypothetical protein
MSLHLSAPARIPSSPTRRGTSIQQPAFSNLPVGSLPAATAKKIHFSGTAVFHIRNGKVTEELGPETGINRVATLGTQ